MNAITEHAKDVLRVSPRIVLMATVLVYLISNQLIALRFGGYFLVAEAISQTLKKLLGIVVPNSSLIYRPVGGGDCHGCGVFKQVGKGCIDVRNHVGMPSGHSLSMAMAATFWSLWIWYDSTGSRVNKITRMSLLVIMALLVLVSRSPLVEGCHTPLQIIIGGLLGVAVGVGMYHFDKNIVQKYTCTIAN